MCIIHPNNTSFFLKKVKGFCSGLLKKYSILAKLPRALKHSQPAFLIRLPGHFHKMRRQVSSKQMSIDQLSYDYFFFDGSTEGERIPHLGFLFLFQWPSNGRIVSGLHFTYQFTLPKKTRNTRGLRDVAQHAVDDSSTISHRSGRPAAFGAATLFPV